MSAVDIEIQVRKALQAAEGNSLVAKRTLLRSAKADPQLLLLLVQPHLEAIIGQAVDRAVQPVAKPKPKPAAAAPGKTINAAAMDLLVGALDRSAPTSAKAQPPKVSQADTMRALAKAFEKKERN